MTASLVHGDAECLPFQDESFDVVFCDHGATVFAPPGGTIPEASRVLKPGGLFAFCISSPIRDICWDARVDKISAELRADYFDLHAIEDSDPVCYQLPYGAWIRLFRQNEFAENIWKVRKRV